MGDDVLTKFLEDTYKVMETQGQGLISTLESVKIERQEALLHQDHIILTGCGDSYAVADYGKWLFLQMGVPSISISPTELGKVPLNSDSTVIGITASGRSLTTVKALAYAKERDAYTIALTDNSEGKVNEMVHELWLTQSGAESYDIVPTAPTTMAMVYLMGLAKVLDKTEKLERDCERIREIMTRGVLWAKTEGEKISEMLSPEGLIYLISEGVGFIAANIGMMKFNEYAIMRSHTVLKEEFRHHGNLPTKKDDTIILITETPITNSDERYIRVIKETLKLNAEMIHTPLDLKIETSFAQTILNTIALQYAAYHNVMRYNPKMEWFKLPNAKAFNIY